MRTTAASDSHPPERARSARAGIRIFANTPMEYDHKAIEKKWQKTWADTKLYRTADVPNPNKSCFVLDMFPYPSGVAMHVGHPKGYVATDVYSRMKKMQGYDVLHPMGWDAFGLPAENYAIKNKLHPKKAVDDNVARFKKQLEVIGCNYDWEREINTTDPAYYKWTQWIFLKLFEKGLAYESHEPINWCPSCKTGLANEDLENGKCERCGSDVEQKPMRQWVLRITKYADRLLEGLHGLDWEPHIKEMQRHWIGKSEGHTVSFGLQNAKSKKQKALDVFTTRLDTIEGATYVVLAPELALLEQIKNEIGNWDEVVAYREQAKQKTDLQRKSTEKEKTGVRLAGVAAVNPVTRAELPVFVADYVMMGYGTGAIMAVPQHDERDRAFAETHGLPIIDIPLRPAEEIAKEIDATKQTHYKLKDWVFSRQRYWGEPIPIIHCEKCGPVGVPEKDLPVTLPEVESYEPTGTGESPLAGITDWVNTTCPKCGGPGKRETNTMPQWAGSSWYYLRYIDPKNNAVLVDPGKEKAWMPVDCYVGGAEHATRHLIYARFWHKFLYDIGVVSTEEPFKRLQHVGLVLAEDGRKMSKRWNNVINPDDVINQFGADSFRTYEMFMGPFENEVAWSTDSTVGVRRFLERVAKLESHVGDVTPSKDLLRLQHETIKKVGDDILAFRFNTAVSALMIFSRALDEHDPVPKDAYRVLLQLLAPFAPHLTEELWSHIGEEGSIHTSAWPQYDTALMTTTEVEIAVQVNGKVRGTVILSPKASEKEAREAVFAHPVVSEWVKSKDFTKFVYVPGKIISIVVKP